jgi:hypothetical protein
MKRTTQTCGHKDVVHKGSLPKMGHINAPQVLIWIRRNETARWSSRVGVCARVEFTPQLAPYHLTKNS